MSQETDPFADFYLDFLMFQNSLPSATESSAAGSSFSDSTGDPQQPNVQQDSTSQNLYNNNNNNEIEFGQFPHHEVPEENYPQQPIVGGYQPVPVETPGTSSVRYNPIQVPSTSVQRYPSIGHQDKKEFSESLSRNPLEPLQFQAFNSFEWCPVYDFPNGNFSQILLTVGDIQNCAYDERVNAFVAYKKNQFQFTARLWFLDQSPPKFVNTGAWMPIKKLKVTFNGVKEESQTSIIHLMQDRNKTRTTSEYLSPEPFIFDFDDKQSVEAKFERLHFMKSTKNNEIKNPLQRYFLFVVNLHAVIETEQGEMDVLVMSFASERIIVRAGSKIEFERSLAKTEHAKNILRRNSSLNLELTEPNNFCFQCNNGVVSTMNPVVIGGTTPLEGVALSVFGNLMATGTISTFSDGRLKRFIKTLDPEQALELLMQLRPVSFEYLPEFAKAMGIENRHMIGFIAQEVQKVLEDAVHKVGDFLAVDEKQICVQGIAATIQLAKNAETMREEIRIHAEQIQSILALGEKRKSESMASGLQDDTSRLSSARDSSKRPIDPLCASKGAQWSILTAIIILMAILAIALVSMVFLYFVELRHRYGSPNATWPLTHHKYDPPENMVVPVEKLWYLQRNVSAISPLCHDDYCHAYCCVGPPVGNLTKHIVGDRKTTTEVNSQFSSLMKTDYVISLPQFNAVLDSRYCIGRSCSSSYGKYHLFVPLSPYLPSTPLRIQFSLTKGKIPKGCGFVREFKNRQCDNSVIDTRSLKMRQVDENSFDLPVGGLLQSAFRFRVGFASDVCKLSKNSHGFDEIVIHFYRKCK